MSLEDDLKQALEKTDGGRVDFEAVLQRIMNGESTGDKVKDFLLISHGGLVDSETEQKYRSLLDKLDSYQGQQVVVAYYNTDKISEGGCFGGPVFNKYSPSQEIGIISGESSYGFNAVDGPFLSVSMKEHLEQGSGSYGRYQCNNYFWEKISGPITVPIIYFRDLHQPMFSSSESTLPTVNIIIGNEQVAINFLFGEEFLNKEHKLTNLLQELPLYERRKQAYAQVLRLLGAEVPEILKQEKIK